MITLEAGRPNELSQSLAMLNSTTITHLRIRMHSHFWHTHDSMKTLKNEMRRFRNLLFLEFTGDSYPSLLDISDFLQFLDPSVCNIRVMKIPISPPFPGQYRIQDRTFLINKILYSIYNCRSIVSVKFYSKYGGDGEDGESEGENECKNWDDHESERRCSERKYWVRELNAKMKSILRNRVFGGTLYQHSHL